MSVDVTTEIVINKWVPEVAAFSTNPDNVPKWRSNVKSVEWKTPRPLRAGTRIAFVKRLLGQKVIHVYEVVEFVPSERLIMRTKNGAFPMLYAYSWSPAELGGTRMTLRSCSFPKGAINWLSPLVTVAVAHSNRKYLTRLKTLLERPSV